MAATVHGRKEGTAALLLYDAKWTWWMSCTAPNEWRMLSVEGRMGIPPLVQLCLRAIAIRLKHFFNASHHAALLEVLTDVEKALLLPYDLSRLDVFEYQGFRAQLLKWRRRVDHKQKKDNSAGIIPRRTPELALIVDTVPIYALRTNLDKDPHYRHLKMLLGVEAPPSVELRVPAQANPFPQRKEWVGNGDSVSPEIFQNSDNAQEKQDHSDWAAQKLFTLDRLNQYRSPITNTGCGAIAGIILRTSNTLRSVRLNHCQITDAGAILLASGLRRSTVLQVLDLSNQISTVVKSKRMDNEIGCSGSLAIALALESNKSLTQLSLSGNPIGAQGGRALATMLQKNHTLKHLELESTKVGEAADDLIDAYSNSHSLEVLNLYWCGLRPAVGAKYGALIAGKNSKAVTS